MVTDALAIIGQILGCLGLVLALVGAVNDLIAAIGFVRFKNFYLRLHALTVGVIGGTFYPLIGLGTYALFCIAPPLRYYVAGVSYVTAFFVLITAPAGSHAIARGAHRAGYRPEPMKEDKLAKDREEGVME